MKDVNLSDIIEKCEKQNRKGTLNICTYVSETKI